MTLQRREKILAAAAGGMALVAACWFLFGIGGTPRERLRIQRDGLKKTVEAKEHLLATTSDDAKKLTNWQQRALPSDPAHARSLYQDWIRALADKAGFRQLNVVPADGSAKKNIYAVSTFTVSGRTDLARLTKFLFDFYSAGHLHKITRIDIKPAEKSSGVDVNLVAEAMSLMSGERKDQLSKDTGKVLQSAKPSDYSDAIVKRNLFAPYSPLSPRPDFDLARYTDVTGIVEVDGRGQVWIHERTSDKTWKLSAGQSFRVGPIQGSVKAFVPPRGPFDQTLVVINVDGRSRLFKQGDNLRGGVAVPDGQQPQ